MNIPARFFECPCGKLHTDSMISQSSRCTCRRELWRVRAGLPQTIPVPPPHPLEVAR